MRGCSPLPPVKAMCTGLNSTVTLFGNVVLTDNRVKMRSHWIRVGLNSDMTGVLARRETQTHQKRAL